MEPGSDILMGEARLSESRLDASPVPPLQKLPGWLLVSRPSSDLPPFLDGYWTAEVLEMGLLKVRLMDG